MGQTAAEHLANWPAAQSALAPAGPGAFAIDRLGTIMILGGAIILALVVMLTIVALRPGIRARRIIQGPRFVVAMGIAFPVITLTALLIYGLVVTRGLVASEAPRLRIEVTGEQWWWRVNYLDADGAVVLSTANEVHIPIGHQIEFILKAADVIHSFWVPALGGKLDMIPGRINILQLTAAKAGVYRGQCAEFCGAQHAIMSLHVVALSPDEFERWWARSVGAAAEPPNDFARRGQQLFGTHGCGACHTVRGTEAIGEIGPDLTRVGSRTSIGAGLLPTNVGTLAGWVSSSQHLKPGNRMPSFDRMEGPDLRALATYLASLR